MPGFATKSFLFPLSLGVGVGFFAAFVALQTSINSNMSLPREYRHPEDTEGKPGIVERIFGDRFIARPEEETGPREELKYDKKHEELHKADETAIADELAQKVRVLCWVLTQPDNHEKKAKHVKATWGKRCNVLLFMSSTSDESLPTIDLPSQEGRNQLWNKTKEAFMYVYKHHYNDADWFIKADDDTYLIVENLRYFLAGYSPKDPVWFGCNFKKFMKEGYMSGGAGYVLSKESLRRFIEESIPDKEKCRGDGHGAEDVEMGRCLENVGVHAGDSRDPEGRWRFLPFTPQSHMIPGQWKKDFWFWEWIKYPYTEGPDCCSDSAISFHYVAPNMMYVMEYLIYHLKPFGRLPHFEMPLLEGATNPNQSPSKNASNAAVVAENKRIAANTRLSHEDGSS